MTSCDVAYCQTSIPRYMATWFAEIKENSDLYECAMKKKKMKKRNTPSLLLDVFLTSPFPTYY